MVVRRENGVGGVFKMKILLVWLSLLNCLRNISVNKVTEEILKLTGKGSVEHGPSVIEPKDTLASNLKAKELLGWNPEIKFEEGLKLVFESMFSSIIIN